MEFIQKYKKVLVNLIGVIVSAVLAAYMGDGIVDTTELANIIIIAAGTLSVGIASNTLAAKYTKGLLAGIAGTATLVFSLATGGITTTEWAQIGVAFAAAAGVFQAKNKGDNLDKEVANC